MSVTGWLYNLTAWPPEPDGRFSQEGVRRCGTLAIVSAGASRTTEEAQIVTRYNLVRRMHCYSDAQLVGNEPGEVTGATP